MKVSFIPLRKARRQTGACLLLLHFFSIVKAYQISSHYSLELPEGSTGSSGMKLGCPMSPGMNSTELSPALSTPTSAKGDPSISLNSSPSEILQVWSVPWENWAINNLVTQGTWKRSSAALPLCTGESQDSQSSIWEQQWICQNGVKSQFSHFWGKQRNIRWRGRQELLFSSSFSSFFHSHGH